jgi:RNA polymerase sigma-70 factor (ECF subfamily)
MANQDDDAALDAEPAPSAPRILHDEDAELIARFRAGDRTAFDAIAIKYRDPILGLVRRYVKNDSDAEDVAQRALLRAFEKLDTFRGESAFRTWLFRIAIHLALNHIRGRDRFQAVELDDIASFTNALETAKLVAAELWQKVSARLDELPPKQRLVVELRLFHELSFKEISTIADCSEESAKANFHHGVKRLRVVIAQPK